MPTTAPELIGRYQVLKAIGEGGMGSLYLARDPAIDRLVAIKLLREGFDTAELRQRFASEARSAGRLHHQNIVTIFDVGEHQKQPFIAMEYVKGRTLGQLGADNAQVPLATKLDWMDKLCAGLHYAHKNGVIHRDIKPANIMIDDEGTLKILDFGIARFGASEMTQAGMVIGTLNYMAPEQMMGKPIDARADIFSVGAVFYELLTYQRAFPGDLSTGIVHKILSGNPEPLRSALPDLPAPLIAIVDRCLEKEPDKRFPDLGAARREIATVRPLVANVEEPELPPRGPDIAAPPVGKRPGTSRENLLRLRAEQIEAHFKDARAAFDGNDMAGCLAACQKALLLDPENRPVLELEQRAQARQDDEHLRGWVSQAKSELGRGALTAASLLVDRALSLSASSPDALKVREAIEQARQELERARQIDDALDAARTHLAAGALDKARESVDAALKLEAGHHAAQTLAREIDEAVRVAKEEKRATDAVAAAREMFAADKIADAIASLTAFAPTHPLVTKTLGQLQAEAKEIERRRQLSQKTVEIPTPVESGPINVRTVVLNEPPVMPLPARPPVAAPPLAPPVGEPPIRTAKGDGIGAPKGVIYAVAGLVVVAIIAVVVMKMGSSGSVAPATSQEPAPAASVSAPAATPDAPPAAPSAPVAAAAPTAVFFNVLPWARIQSITSKSDQKSVGLGDAVTPVVVNLAPGDYHVRATNPAFSAPLEFDVTVSPGTGVQEVRQSMPGFQADREIDQILK